MNNPEFRQTIHNITHNLETANQTAQENIYTFTQSYVDPCLASIRSCITECTAPCFLSNEENLRRKRGRPRGRGEYNFDFYDAWEDEEDLATTGMAWGTDELDSLLAGRGSTSVQPKRQRAMSYGSRGRKKAQLSDDADDPTVIESSSYLGFLERLPWKIGVRKLRYRPSAADLQVNPGGMRVRDGETEPLIEEHEHETQTWKKGHHRQRSDTVNSKSTTNSLSSRGDLIMSDEEDDAVPLDDEFAVALSRRMTNQGISDEQSSGKHTSPSGKRPAASRRSTRTVSSKSASSKSQRSASQRSLIPVAPESADEVEPPTLLELQLEEQQVAEEEELEVQQKREAAQRLALERGLGTSTLGNTTETKPDSIYEADAEDEPNAPSPKRPSKHDAREQDVDSATTESVNAANAANAASETESRDDHEGSS